MIRIVFLILVVFSVKVSSQSLDDYLEIAKQNNYEIKLKNSEFELAKEQVNEVGNFKNTDFSLGIFALTPETRVGSQLLKVGASQQLPWFGELEAQKKLQEAKATVKEYDIVLSERELLFQVKTAYYELYQKQALSLIFDENKQILMTYENMSLSALENNRATMSDVLGIRVQKNILHMKRFQNINAIESLSKNFNRLLQRAVNEPLYIADSLNVLDILMTNTKIDKHPVLEKTNAKQTIYQSELDLIDKDKTPKISVGIDYILVEQRTDFSPDGNGKDIIMPKVSLSIPIFNNKTFTSQKSQFLLKEEMLKDEIESNKKLLNMELETANLQVENAILSVMAAQKNKEETQRAINVDLKAYETGILNYGKILRLQLQKINYQLLEIEATKKAFIALAKVTYLTN